jgi:hypothetical protein
VPDVIQAEDVKHPPTLRRQCIVDIGVRRAAEHAPVVLAFDDLTKVLLVIVAAEHRKAVGGEAEGFEAAVETEVELNRG